MKREVILRVPKEIYIANEIQGKRDGIGKTRKGKRRREEEEIRKLKKKH